MPQAPLDAPVATELQHICDHSKAHSCQEEGQILSRHIFSLRFLFKAVLSFLPGKPPPALHTHTDSSLCVPPFQFPIRVPRVPFIYFSSKPWLLIVNFQLFQFLRNDNLPVPQVLLFPTQIAVTKDKFQISRVYIITLVSSDLLLIL